MFMKWHPPYLPEGAEGEGTGHWVTTPSLSLQLGFRLLWPLAFSQPCFLSKSPSSESLGWCVSALLGGWEIS